MNVHNQRANHAICGQLGIGTVDKCPKRTMPVPIQKAEGGCTRQERSQERCPREQFLIFFVKIPLCP